MSLVPYLDPECLGRVSRYAVAALFLLSALRGGKGPVPASLPVCALGSAQRFLSCEFSEFITPTLCTFK